MREIVIDTETTGLDPLGGDRLIEIGCIELVNRFPTGKVFHQYLNPEREVPPEAFAVHGLSTAFLRDKPRFSEISDALIAFLGEAPLVAHNALFDLGFINAELERCGRSPLGRERVIDTLLLARRRHPAAPNRLDDLCARYGIDNSRRTKHGALLDAELLSEVYVELAGGRQASLVLMETGQSIMTSVGNGNGIRTRPAPLPPRLTEAETVEHARFVATLGEKAIWHGYGLPS